MSNAQRAGLAALSLLCAAETAAIIAYYATPVIRMALAALIGLVIVTVMVTAVRAAHRGDLVRHHPGPVSEVPAPARVYHLPQPSHSDTARDDEATRADHPRRVIRLDQSRE